MQIVRGFDELEVRTLRGRGYLVNLQKRTREGDPKIDEIESTLKCQIDGGSQ